MTEPAASIFATLFVLFAAFMLWRAVRGRFGSRPRTFRLGIAALAGSELCMAVFALFMSTPPIFGLPWSVRSPMVGLAIVIGFASGFVGLFFIVIDPKELGPLLSAYTPQGLRHMLFGKRGHHTTSAGE